MGTRYLRRRLGQHLADAKELTAPRTWNNNSADSQARQNRHLEHDFAINAQIAHGVRTHLTALQCGFTPFTSTDVSEYG